MHISPCWDGGIHGNAVARFQQAELLHSYPPFNAMDGPPSLRETQNRACRSNHSTSVARQKGIALKIWKLNGCTSPVHSPERATENLMPDLEVVHIKNFILLKKVRLLALSDIAQLEERFLMSVHSFGVLRTAYAAKKDRTYEAWHPCWSRFEVGEFVAWNKVKRSLPYRTQLLPLE